jgi:nicotinamidase-related amidase
LIYRALDGFRLSIGHNDGMARSALMIMDIQGAVVSRIDEPDALLTSIKRALDHARATGMVVIYVRVAFRAGAPEVHRRNRMFSRLGGSSGYEEDDAATQIDPSVAPLATEIVVTKRRVSAFAGSDLDMILRSSEVDELVLCGISTSGVVLSTLRQAADLDYQLVVLRDGCADTDAEVHRVLLDKVFPRQADVMTVDDWILRGADVS